ncbi:MAG TPA: sialate O-acetylesterase [Sunxiuqinia sp.]|nr:sialate O-acetylesterase [Sunxiuqinia sp.]
MNFKKIILSISFIFIAVFIVQAKVTLPKLIADGMVLQRNIELKLWGWASPNEKVTVKFMGSNYSAVTDENGKWQLKLPKLQAGGPFDMTISGENTITIKDILVGDVWLCSGQSNMELTMDRVSPMYPEVIKHPENKFVRYFQVPKTYNFNKPQTKLESGKWVTPTAENIRPISAVSYFFATTLYDSLHVPIGIINSALGGSPIESWIDENSLKKFPKYYQEAQRFKSQQLIDSIKQADQTRIGNWYAHLQEKDKGYQNPTQNWRSPNLNTADWSTMNVPGYWADTPLGEVNGVVWFRKDIDVPACMVGKPAKLLMGRIVDADSVFVNGSYVGNTTYQYPPRRYTIPASVLKAGKNTIVVRVISNQGRGGFVPDKPYQLSVGNQTIDLKGKWKYRLGATMDPLASQTFIRWKPTGLYNAMLAPLENYRIKGAVWYQGESNADRPVEYSSLLKTMINSWREKWGEGDFPFLIVQLPNYMEAKEEPSESDWALLRESQAKALELPNTGMAVTIDLGEWNDIHPLDKKDVGKRLTWVAQKVAYGNDQITSLSPMFKSMKLEGDTITVTFKDTDGGLMVKGGGELKQFAIAGKDQHFVWAKAKIIAPNQVEIWSEQVPHPVAVRYAWADNPDGVNLYNKKGLPAAPFRTDQWTER